MKHPVEAVLSWLGTSLDPDGKERLERFAAWLSEEALPAGGIGPGERERIPSRHIAESLAFACGVDADAGSVLDIGSGAGLPGIPLAILRPQTRFLLVDRSGRRVDLAARALRVLDLPNAAAVQADVRRWQERTDGIVMRGALRPEAALPHIGRLLRPGRRAALGLSRTQGDPCVDDLAETARRAGLQLAVITVPVLDSPTSLLRITRNVHDS